MPYEPLVLKSKTFADLKIGEKFFFYSDLRRGVHAEHKVKVSDDSFIGLGRDGNGGAGLGRPSETEWASPVERCGMMSEEKYREITASFRK